MFRPGYSITTHGQDDMADAAVMAITEAHRLMRKPNMVHDYSADNLVVPGHQKLLSVVYGNDIPAHAIDKG